MTLEDSITPVAPRKCFRKFNDLFFGLLLLSTTSQASPIQIYKVDGDSIRVTKDNQTRICILDAHPTDAVESYDGSAIMVSYRGYISKNDLDNCTYNKPLHVQMIPDKVGTISDINVKHNIYVALGFVSTQPLTYLATVARIGTSKNLVSIKGAYDSKKIKDLRDDAFLITTGNEIGTAIISPNGKFVSPDGTMSCSEDAYPGVWDITSNKRIITDKASCEHLFDKVEN
jgi:hypothetical protein